jgi:hypothetical protein
MKRLICLTLVIMLTCNMYLIADVSAVTYVNGSIGSNVIWTKENSPYILTGNILINNNETLTIEPGVTVDLGGYYLQVNGTLNARGQSVDRIFFISNSALSRIEFLDASVTWNEQTTLGSIIENSIIRVTLVINSSVKINFNTFNSTAGTGVQISGGSPIITNNIFSLQSSTISISGGSTVFSYNTITGNRYLSGIYVGIGGVASISDNNVSGCYTGIYTAGNTTIHSNLIVNNAQGIVSNNQFNFIQNNVIAGNNLGVTGFGNIQSNTVVNNSVGIRFLSGEIKDNNIYHNFQNLVSATSITIDASNNWWGTIDVTDINSTIIYSKTSSLGLGAIVFVPFLMKPNPLAPQLPNVVLNPVLPITPPTSHPPYPTVAATPAPTAIIVSPPTATQSPTTTPKPTPSPTPKIVPGSPLTLGSENFGEMLAQMNIMDLAKLVLAALGIMWVFVILVAIGGKYVAISKKS